MRLTSWLELFRYRLNWRNWLLRTRRAKRRSLVTHRSPEALEDRILLSNLQWQSLSAGTYQWNDPANWSFGQVPGPGDKAIFTNTANLVIQGAATAYEIEVQSAGDLRFTTGDWGQIAGLDWI